jgi:hypothetical protein
MAAARKSEARAGTGAGTVELYDDVPLTGVPHGLRARVRRRLRTDADGREVEIRDRRGRTKLTSVYLYAPESDAAIKPTERELTFLLGADRRDWDTVAARLGRGDDERAWSRACVLARAGAIEIECAVDDVSLGRPLRWRLTEPWQRRRKQRATRRANERASWSERAEIAAVAIGGRYPELAHALARHGGGVERRVLVHAAEDLLAGLAHHGPRAFSQRHFGTTKARDDVGRILARCGIEADAQVELGVLRAGRTGLAGPVELRSACGYLNFAGIQGPTDVRLDQQGLTLTTVAVVLVVIENRQAAETVSDRYPMHAVFWTQGMMGPESRGALSQLAAGVQRVLACPDADLGGVRIAEQILRVAPHAEIVDIGQHPHAPRQPFKPDSVSEIGLKAALTGPACEFAAACLLRGYPVEQELAAVDAVDAAIGGQLAEPVGPGQGPPHGYPTPE